MAISAPNRWTPRSLMAILMPHLFRAPRTPAESTGPRTEKVPLDAHMQHVRVKKKTKSYHQSVHRRFELKLHRPKDLPKSVSWSLATGGWVPDRDQQVEPIFPRSLGNVIPMELRDIGNSWKDSNGLVLPHPVARAFHDWALVVVPSDSQRAFRFPQAYDFKVLDPRNKDLKLPLYPKSSIVGLDLDRKSLHFRKAGGAMPCHASLHFHTCCAVWKLTYLEKPDADSDAEFWERFQSHMTDLWGIRRERIQILDLFKPTKPSVRTEMLREYKQTQLETAIRIQKMRREHKVLREQKVHGEQTLVRRYFHYPSSA